MHETSFDNLSELNSSMFPPSLPFAYIDFLPDEVLEYVLSMTSPYRDYPSARLVCKRWERIIRDVSDNQYKQFVRAASRGTLIWSMFTKKNSGPTVAKRYSHSACYFNKSLFVFGGCTSSATTFNDLWRFDLVNNCWIRPLATGTYPSPKAWASLVAYNESLILFGGWSHPIPSSLHQAPKFFRQLHQFFPERNEWSLVTSQNCPEGKAGHGATIVDNKMVVFGGCHGFENSCNDVWVLDLNSLSWVQKRISGPSPLPRYSHSQVLIDDSHLLIIGGCGGANKQFSDAWILDMSGDYWFWQEMSIVNPDLSAPQLWCHPGCKVGDQLIVVSKNCKYVKSLIEARKDKGVPPPAQSSSPNCVQENVSRLRPSTAEKQEERTQGRLGFEVDNQPHSDAAMSPPLGDASGSHRNGMPAVRPNSMNNRQRQLEMLKKYEEKIRQERNAATPANKNKPLFDVVGKFTLKHSPSPMCIHTLDLADAVSHGRVTWLPVSAGSNSKLCNIPEETLFYSLVKGQDELIVFGGIESDLLSMQKGLPVKPDVSNSVHFLSFREHVS